MSPNGSPAPRPSTSRLIRSQFESTPPAVSVSAPASSSRASDSSKTCGWRRISFSVTASATVAERARAALLEQQREEDDLEQDVAELVEDPRVVAARRRVGELIGLLDGVRDDRALVLLAIPRALDPQPARDLVEPLERVRARRALAHVGGLARGRGAGRCARLAVRHRRRRGAGRRGAGRSWPPCVGTRPGGSCSPPGTARPPA